MRAPQYLKLFAVVLVAGGLLAGCATSGIKYTDVVASVPKLKRGQGRIYFYRTVAPGLAVQPEIKVNGVAVGPTLPGGFFYVDRPAGTYELVATTEIEEKITVTLAAGETKYVRTFISPGLFVGHFNFDVVGREKAEADLEQLQQTGVSEGKPK